MSSGAASLPTLRLGLGGFAIAWVAAMCGIGGGIFCVPLLHLVYRYPMRRSVATALGLVATTAVLATAAELLSADSRLSGRLLLWLVPGALVGAQLGFWIAGRLEARRIKQAFVVVLVVGSWRLLWPGVPSVGEGGPIELSSALGLLVLGVGLAGGMVAPLFGLGGGLVFVPALFLLVPGVDFPAARAASLAVSVVSSARSLWLYGRAGEIALPMAGRLAVGAAVGAVLGVFTIHRVAGAVPVARIGLGLILLYAAFRMARDLWREGATQA